MLSVDEADGILYTEYKTLKAEFVKCPIDLVSNHVRAAHIYNIAISHARENFAIAGLQPLNFTFCQNETYLKVRVIKYDFFLLVIVHVIQLNHVIIITDFINSVQEQIACSDSRSYVWISSIGIQWILLSKSDERYG